MAYTYATLDQFLEASNEERSIDRSDVAPRVLAMQVWHAIESFPGCLGDNHAVARSKAHAIDSVCCWLPDNEPRGWRKALQRDGIHYTNAGRVITLEKHAVSELF